MKRLLVAALSFGLVSGASAVLAADCPPELAQAQAALKTAQAALKSTKKAKMQEVQAPRAQAGARTQEVQAPKMQEVQAPKMQEVQAPKMQEVQAPKVSKARALVRQAEQACKKGDMTASAAKAKDALALLK